MGISDWSVGKHDPRPVPAIGQGPLFISGGQGPDVPDRPRLRWPDNTVVMARLRNRFPSYQNFARQTRMNVRLETYRM